MWNVAVSHTSSYACALAVDDPVPHADNLSQLRDAFRQRWLVALGTIQRFSNDLQKPFDPGDGVRNPPRSPETSSPR